MRTAIGSSECRVDCAVGVGMSPKAMSRIRCVLTMTWRTPLRRAFASRLNGGGRAVGRIMAIWARTCDVLSFCHDR